MSTSPEPSSSPALDRVRRTASEVFGRDVLRPGQAAASTSLLEGHDVLLVAPTGAGKSLTYQVPGLLLDGPCVVVSPLIALQQDQVGGLIEHGARAARLSSAETEAQREQVLASLEAGELDFVFLAPEQLAVDEVRRRIAAARPGLVAVDEAHCVSTWGSDFRPDYARLGELIDELGQRPARPRVVAMTATAAPPVREDITARLHLREPRTVVTDFARENLSFRVVPVADGAGQQRAVLEAAAAPGCGIVYCRTRPATEEYADLLGAEGRRVAAYHAGLPQRRRAETLEAFLAGELDVVVATSAFGMGIDKPDVRWVVHAQAPESPDTYYQEAGRAGRDGQEAVATLVHRPEDHALGRFFAPSVPGRGEVRRVLALAPGVEMAAAQEETGLGRRKIQRIRNLAHLAEESGRGTGADAVLELAEAQRSLERSRVEMMRAYAEGRRCREELLLAYLGASLDERCGRCDTCEDGRAEEGRAEEGAPAEATYVLQERVVHAEFGAGVVSDVETDRVTVLFDDVGYRTLSLEVVEREDLLDTVG
ncbi:ATP-dependent DNA helicase RecQ [Nocardioides dokdonensis FR1436]|uniref:ATP-dependent DNA helicase RecQ n=1 Tax=Nocardioides dokdonensis FR1436 TaxID=1300347 RepID=A0A1A9GPB0_9ACTN|nr:RecQ family ATP-dependent DNA helicase [Nocardioides dokdonensis]ANH39443.1 ATP-dependent DNA helicase RecQ [Nocardioides dokdonensis FR1436]